MNMDFGTELRVAMARAHINQKVLGKLLGVHVITVSRWVVGTHVPTAENIAKIRKLIKLDGRAIRAFVKDAGLKRARKSRRKNGTE